ncbi:hypothetical protein ACISOG_09205 [Campylobacter jejuni]
MVETSCYRDLTRKTKIKGLTSTSWFALIILGFIAWFFLVLYSLIVVSDTHLRAQETRHEIVSRLMLENKN